MTNKEIAKQILENVGGASNVTFLTHCVTRLRFSLKNEGKANTDKLEALEGVLGVQKQGGQFQVIVGGKVNKLYAELTEMLPQLDNKEEGDGGDKKKKSVITRIFETLSAILIPSLPPIIGGGMIKGFLFMFWEFGWIEWGSDIFNLLNIMSDGMFYFYPFLLAVSTAKRFKTNIYMALALAGILMHPTIYDGINAGLASFFVFGLKIPYLDYNSSVIPIILSVWIMSYVYRFFEKRIPEIISVIFTPMLTLVVMTPLMLGVVAPLGYNFGEYLAKGIQAIIDFSPILAGFVVGALRPITVFTGTHHAVRAIVSQQLATYGYTTIGAMNYMSTMAQAAAPLAIYLVIRNKNKKMRDISLSAAISGFLGVTEPGLYGVVMKYKVAFVAASIGGGVGAAICSYFGGAEYAMVMSSLVTIPATFGNGFIGVAIGLPVAVIVTMAIILAFRDKVLEEDAMLEKSGGALALPAADESSENEKILSVNAPAEGTVKALADVSDKTFSEEKVGKGVAISPEKGEIYAPADGQVVMFPASCHAIGLKTDDGMELLVHVGIDTVKLEGKHFNACVKEGDHVTQGQKLLEFDLEKIKEEGYETDVIVLVTNADDYLDIFPNAKLIHATSADKLLNIIA